MRAARLIAIVLLLLPAVAAEAGESAPPPRLNALGQ